MRSHISNENEECLSLLSGPTLIIRLMHVYAERQEVVLCRDGGAKSQPEMFSADRRFPPLGHSTTKNLSSIKKMSHVESTTEHAVIRSNALQTSLYRI